jgi:ribosome maturation factor RimP
MSLHTTIETTVRGLGYDCVEIDRSAGGLLRVTIENPWVAGAVEVLVTVEDCEKVTRQLQFALEVDAVEYRRLEVSSPGIDRPLKGEVDFARFVGSVIDVTLKAPIGVQPKAEVIEGQEAAAKVSGSRKKFRGTLERADSGVAGAWQIVWSDAPVAKPGAKVSKKRAAAPLQALGFHLGEIKEARLAPIVDFKGRQAAPV